MFLARPVDIPKLWSMLRHTGTTEQLMNFIIELKRRNVFRVGIAYVVLGWVVIQVTDTVAPALNLPEWTLALVTWLGIIGFPFALLLAWAFEMTPEGIKLEKNVVRSESIAPVTGRKLDFAIIGLLLAAVGFLVVDNYVLQQPKVAEAPASEPAAAAVKNYGSIAVLPFANISNDPDQEYFSDGISEELLNALSRLRNLQVAARTSSFAFKDRNLDVTEIGNKLKVETLLEGSVRKSGNRVRITAQLIDVDNGYHLWSETYDRELTDVFAIQDELTKAIVAALKVHLATGETAATTGDIGNWEAYDAYLKGLHGLRQRRPESVTAAIDYFQAALSLEPDFAAAMAKQAQALMLSATYSDIPWADATARARALLDQALALNPGLAEAHAASGFLLLYDGRGSEGLERLNRALTLDPGLVEALHWRAIVLRNQGHVGEALASSQQAHLLDPMHGAVFGLLSSFEIDYGLPVRLELELVQQYHPERYALYQLRTLSSRGNWADALELLRASPESSILARESWIVITRARLKERSEAAVARLAARATDPETDIFLWEKVTFGDYEAAEAFLAGVDSDTLANHTVEGYRGVIQYFRGINEQAQVTLTRAMQDYDIMLFGNAWFLRSSGNALDLADVLQRRGDHAAAADYMDRVRELLSAVQRGGARYGVEIDAAKLKILEGDHAAAIALLRQKRERGALLWYEMRGPLFERLADEPDFVKLQADLNQHIDAERAKLGWPPADF